ncbi:chorismate mutase [Shewanella maritima]|uniref:chorismate mutase n=1 Tax=Shewanella maritima TaxID=2520507 RepID=UPI0037358DE4
MSKLPKLGHTREQITALDKQLLSLLSKRRELSLDVARSKEVDVRPIRDVQREKELLERLVQQGREQGLEAHYVISLYQSIIEDSVLNQQAYLHSRANQQTQQSQTTVAYLGARGSYSYLAASRYCDRRQVEMVDYGCQSFDDIINAVERGHADYGFLPIENTSSGSINEVYDVLQHTSLSIVGETTIEVGHCLLAKKGTSAKDITTVYAHPQPISQCSSYLRNHPELKLQYCSSSAEAMNKVIESTEVNIAAIGSAEGGALYQLEVIEEDLANQQINQSRFIVVARKAVEVPVQLPAKTTLIMATGHKPGALVEALIVLRNHQLNMTKLESRPITGTPWEEMFYLDIDANLASESVQQAIQELGQHTRFIKVLGCYPCETVKPTQLSQAQLLIEPNSSKGLEQTTSIAKHDRSYKEQTTLEFSHFSISDNAFSTFKWLTLSSDINAITLQAKQAKESGFNAVICQHDAKLASREISEALKAISQAGLASILYLEHGNELPGTCQDADALMISGQYMFDTGLLTQAGSLSKPVLLERHSNANNDEWLASADTLLNQGNLQIGLVDSGIINTNDAKVMLDLASIIAVKAKSHLPILVNTAQIATTENLQQHATAVKQLGLSGVIIQVEQSIQTEVLQAMLN